MSATETLYDSLVTAMAYSGDHARMTATLARMNGWPYDDVAAEMDRRARWDADWMKRCGPNARQNTEARAA